MLDKWRRARRRKWLLPLGVFVAVGLLMIPASSGGATIPTATTFRGHVNQNGVNDVGNIFVNNTSHQPCCGGVTVRASTATSAVFSNGNTGGNGGFPPLSIKVTFSNTTAGGTVCLGTNDFNVDVAVPGLTFATGAVTTAVTFAPFEDTACTTPPSKGSPASSTGTLSLTGTASA